MLKPNETVLIITSPYKRARQTTDEIAKELQTNQIPFKVSEEPRLREQDFGNFQGSSEEMNSIWLDRARYGHFFYRIPNGESAADVYDRCAGFNEFPQVLVLVSHGIWARVFLMKWFSWTFQKFESLRNIPHCQFIVMKRDDPDIDRFELKTHLRTWDDDDDEIDNNVDELAEAALPGGDITRQDLETLKLKEQLIMEHYHSSLTKNSSSASLESYSSGNMYDDGYESPYRDRSPVSSESQPSRRRHHHHANERVSR
jgi:broad specificity phosphatase PhoE